MNQQKRDYDTVQLRLFVVNFLQEKIEYYAIMLIAGNKKYNNTTQQQICK